MGGLFPILDISGDLGMDFDISQTSGSTVSIIGKNLVGTMYYSTALVTDHFMSGKALYLNGRLLLILL